MSPDSVSLATTRKWQRGWMRVLLALVIVSGMSIPCVAGHPEWVEIRSPHFRIYTDSCEKQGQDVAARFEEMRAVFTSLMQQMSVDPATPLKIIAFRDTTEFRRFAPLWNGKPTEVGGLFVSGPQRSFILLDLSVPSPWQVIFHEYAHQLIRGNFPAPVEPWFDEGFAEYVATLSIDQHEVRVGRIREETLALLHQGRLMKVADIMKVQRDSRTYRENGHRQDLFYAQSTLLVHFLLSRNLLSRIPTYLELVANEDYSVEEATQEAFGMNVQELDSAGRAYLKSGSFPERRMTRRNTPAMTTFTTRFLATPESQELLTDIHLQTPDYREKTAERLHEVLRKNLGDVAAARGLGYFYLQNQDVESAQKYFQMAATGDSADPGVYYYAAYLASHRGHFGERATLPRIMLQLRKAISLDPEYADAYALLGSAQLFAGDAAQAVALVQRAISLNPRNETNKFKLAQIYWLTGRTDDAVAILRTLLKASDAEVASKARRMLLQAGTAKRAEGDEHSSQLTPQRFVEPAERQPLAPVEPMPSAPDREQATVKFLKGTVTSVDCSRAPSAVLTVVSGVKTWMMRVPSTDNVVLIGADRLSCSWKRTKVAVNYRQIADGEGHILSVEVQ